jgi:ABC-type branched-subunit amino acid transport system ATPase component
VSPVLQRRDGAPPDLELTAVSVSFGGLQAVSDLSLSAAPGRVTGLIGPNGAGKTTTFNATTGTVEYSGSVRLGDLVLDGCSPATRAQRGLGRTFQRIALFDTMTVLDNVAMGPEMLDAGRRVWHHAAGRRRERRTALAAAEAALDRCGISDLADRPAADLSTGNRRLVELARVMASPFRFLLLDEPSSGLDAAETERFAALLAGIVDERGIGILLVEHDMALVRAVCSYVYVLDFGALLFSGSTAEALSSDVVKAAYLGSEALAGEVV